MGGIRQSGCEHGTKVRRRVSTLERNRALATGVLEPLGDQDIDYLVVLLGDPCSYCGAPGSHTDHIDARGRSDWANFTAACTSCNTSKQRLPLLRFMLGKRLRAMRAAIERELATAQPEHFERMRHAKVFADAARA